MADVRGAVHRASRLPSCEFHLARKDAPEDDVHGRGGRQAGASSARNSAATISLALGLGGGDLALVQNERYHQCASSLVFRVFPVSVFRSCSAYFHPFHRYKAHLTTGFSSGGKA